MKHDVEFIVWFFVEMHYSHFSYRLKKEIEKEMLEKHFKNFKRSSTGE